MQRKLIALLLIQLLATSVQASRLIILEVGRQADSYEIRVEMLVDAPVDSVRAILTDYANLDRLNASITSSRIIDNRQTGAVRVLTRIENCVLLFCRTLQKVEDVTEDEQGRILANVVPGASSFRSGQASWELRAAGESTRVIHHARLEPDIWIPPWMGTAILKDTLRREVRESFETLDCMARRQCVNHAERTVANNSGLPVYDM